MTGSTETRTCLPVKYCVKYFPFAGGSPQKKGINPEHQLPIKSVKGVSGVDQLSFVNCHKCPTCCNRSTCRGQISSVLGKMGSPRRQPQSCNSPQGRLHPTFRFRPNLTRSPVKGHKLLCSSPQEPLPVGGIASAYGQNCSGTGSKSNIPGFLQPAIFSPQTRQTVETYPGSKQSEQIFKDRVFQNGDPRDNHNLPTNRRVGDLNRFQACILPHTYSEPVKEVHVFSYTGQLIPIQSTTIWPLHSSHGVHCSGQRGQVSGTTKGYKDQPVPRRLVGQSQIPSNLSPANTELSSSLPRIRMASEWGKIRTGAPTGFQLRRLPVLSERRQGQIHTGTLADPPVKDKNSHLQSNMPGPGTNAPNRFTHCHRETSTPRATSHETNPMAFEKSLENTGIARKGDTRS